MKVEISEFLLDRSPDAVIATTTDGKALYIPPARPYE
jgi:hypothetical protein